MIEPQRDAEAGSSASSSPARAGGTAWACVGGAYGMALRGAGYRDILAHYYRGTALEQISASER